MTLADGLRGEEEVTGLERRAGRAVGVTVSRHG